MRIEATIIERARAIRIENEIARRRIRLRRVGAELIGPCPRHGGDDRFAINTKRRLWNCRGAEGGNDAISMVMHVDGTGFRGSGRDVDGRTGHYSHRAARTAASGCPGCEDRGRSPNAPVSRAAVARGPSDRRDARRALLAQPRPRHSRWRVGPRAAVSSTLPIRQ